MKKIALLAAILICLTQGVSLFAQQRSTFRESDMHYFNFPVERVFAHRLGYVILYRTNSNRIARTFIPHEFFWDAAGRGEVIYLRAGSEWPSISVFYRDGEFSHVRLRLRQNRAHQTWGIIPLGANIDEHFRDIQVITLEHH